MGRAPSYKAEEGWDAGMREALQRESVALLRHQVKVECDAQASLQRSDFMVALSVVGLSFGFGFGLGAFPMIRMPGQKKKRRSRG